MTKFEVGVVRSTAGDHVIGYKVTSSSRGGIRVHLDRRRGEKAKADCERYAALLQAEHDATTPEERAAASRHVARFQRDLDARDAARKVERAARLSK